MGIRWTRNDSEAYKSVSDAGEKLRKSYEDYLAGQAYEKAAAGAKGDVAATYGPADQATDYTGIATPSDGVIQPGEATARQKMKAGIAGLGSHYAGRGDSQGALRMAMAGDTLQSNELQQRAAEGELEMQPLRKKQAEQGLELGGINLDSAKAKQKLDAFIQGTASLDDKGFLSAAAKFATDNKQDNLGFTIRTDPETGQHFLQMHDRDTREFRKEIPWDGDRKKVVDMVTRYHSAESYAAAKAGDRADEELRLKGEDIKRRAANEERTYKLQQQHYGNVAVHNKQMYDKAAAQAELMETRFGKNSPEYKAAELKFKQEEAWNDGLTSVAKLVEGRADPQKVFARAAEISQTAPSDKLLKGEKFDPATGMKTSTWESPLLLKAKEYTKVYANEKQAELSGKYDPNVSISVIPGANGAIGYVSSKTPKGVVYKSEDEMVKADKIKPMKGLSRPVHAPEGTPTATQRAPSNERVGVAAYVMNPPTNEDLTPDDSGRVGLAKRVFGR